MKKTLGVLILQWILAFSAHAQRGPLAKAICYLNDLNGSTQTYWILVASYDHKYSNGESLTLSIRNGGVVTDMQEYVATDRWAQGRDLVRFQEFKKNGPAHHSDNNFPSAVYLNSKSLAPDSFIIRESRFNNLWGACEKLPTDRPFIK